MPSQRNHPEHEQRDLIEEQQVDRGPVLDRLGQQREEAEGDEPLGARHQKQTAITSAAAAGVMGGDAPARSARIPATDAAATDRTTTSAAVRVGRMVGTGLDDTVSRLAIGAAKCPKEPPSDR